MIYFDFGDRWTLETNYSGLLNFEAGKFFLHEKHPAIYFRLVKLGLLYFYIDFTILLKNIFKYFF